MAVKSWRKVTSVEELAHLSELGVRVRSDDVSILNHPRKAMSVMGFSSRALILMIQKGLWYEADSGADGADEGSILSRVQSKIRATGLSTTDIAKLVGVSRQAAAKFLSSKSVQTRVLERYMKETGVSI